LPKSAECDPQRDDAAKFRILHKKMQMTCAAGCRLSSADSEHKDWRKRGNNMKERNAHMPKKLENEARLRPGSNPMPLN
jgi:hypothetical protein